MPAENGTGARYVLGNLSRLVARRTPWAASRTADPRSCRRFRFQPGIGRFRSVSRLWRHPSKRGLTRMKWQCTNRWPKIPVRIHDEFSQRMERREIVNNGCCSYCDAGTVYAYRYRLRPKTAPTQD